MYSLERKRVGFSLLAVLLIIILVFFSGNIAVVLGASTGAGDNTSVGRAGGDHNPNVSAIFNNDRKALRYCLVKVTDENGAFDGNIVTENGDNYYITKNIDDIIYGNHKGAVSQRRYVMNDAKNGYNQSPIFPEILDWSNTYLIKSNEGYTFAYKISVSKNEKVKRNYNLLTQSDIKKEFGNNSVMYKLKNINDCIKTGSNGTGGYFYSSAKYIVKGKSSDSYSDYNDFLSVDTIINKYFTKYDNKNSDEVFYIYGKDESSKNAYVDGFYIYEPNGSSVTRKLVTYRGTTGYSESDYLVSYSTIRELFGDSSNSTDLYTDTGKSGLYAVSMEKAVDDLDYWERICEFFGTDSDSFPVDETLLVVESLCYTELQPLGLPTNVDNSTRSRGFKYSRNRGCVAYTWGQIYPLYEVISQNTAKLGVAKPTNLYLDSHVMAFIGLSNINKVPKPAVWGNDFYKYIGRYLGINVQTYNAYMSSSKYSNTTREYLFGDYGNDYAFFTGRMYQTMFAGKKLQNVINDFSGHSLGEFTDGLGSADLVLKSGDKTIHILNSGSSWHYAYRGKNGKTVYSYVLPYTLNAGCVYYGKPVDSPVEEVINSPGVSLIWESGGELYDKSQGIYNFNSLLDEDNGILTYLNDDNKPTWLTSKSYVPNNFNNIRKLVPSSYLSTGRLDILGLSLYDVYNNKLLYRTKALDGQLEEDYVYDKEIVANATINLKNVPLTGIDMSVAVSTLVGQGTDLSNDYTSIASNTNLSGVSIGKRYRFLGFASNKGNKQYIFSSGSPETRFSALQGVLDLDGVDVKSLFNGDGSSTVSLPVDGVGSLYLHPLDFTSDPKQITDETATFNQLIADTTAFLGTSKYKKDSSGKSYTVSVPVRFEYYQKYKKLKSDIRVVTPGDGDTYKLSDVVDTLKKDTEGYYTSSNPLETNIASYKPSYVIFVPNYVDLSLDSVSDKVLEYITGYLLTDRSEDFTSYLKTADTEGIFSRTKYFDNVETNIIDIKSYTSDDIEGVSGGITLGADTFNVSDKDVTGGVVTYGYDIIIIADILSTPTPEPSIVTPIITPDLTITPDITITPEVTPEITPDITITPKITPEITPDISITPSISPSITPDITPVADIDAVALEEYKLNDYTNNIISESLYIENSINDTLIIRPNVFTYTTPKFEGECTIGSHTDSRISGTHGKKYINDYERYFVNQFMDISGGTPIVDRDSGKFLGKYLLKLSSNYKVDRSVWTKEWEYKHNTEVVTPDGVDPKDKSLVVDYAFNFIRSGVGDRRVVSAVSHSGVAGDGANPDNILDLDVGVKTDSSLVIRNTLFTGSEMLTFDSRSDETSKDTYEIDGVNIMNDGRSIFTTLCIDYENSCNHMMSEEELALTDNVVPSLLHTVDPVWECDAYVELNCTNDSENCSYCKYDLVEHTHSSSCTTSLICHTSHHTSSCPMVILCTEQHPHNDSCADDCSSAHHTSTCARGYSCTTSHHTSSCYGYTCVEHTHSSSCCEAEHGVAKCTHTCGTTHIITGKHRSSLIGFDNKDGNFSGFTGQTISYSFNLKAYKYNPISLGVGKIVDFPDTDNEFFKTIKVEGNSAEVAIKNNPIVGDPYGCYIDGKSGYRVAYVQANRSASSVDKNYYDVTSLNFRYYPEVLMSTRYMGDTYDNNVEFDSLYTVGEKRREVQSYTLYLYRIVGKDKQKSVQGSVMSDSALGTSQTQGYHGVAGNVPIVPAGSDIMVFTDMDNTHLNLYGYGLDIMDVDRDKSKGFPYLNSSLTVDYIPYENYVKYGGNLLEEYETSSGYSTLFNNFKSYVKVCTDARNYQVDMTLLLNYGYMDKYYNNFNATLGYITKESEVQEYSYPIVIEKGKIDRGDKGYIELINQIARDYILESPTDSITSEDYAKAESVFLSSQMYTSLIEAMETCEHSNNGSSSGHYTEKNGNEVLGNNQHWYDESTRTFVIRRFKCEENKFKDIILADKLDLGSTATSNTKYATGRWYLTLYYDTNKNKSDSYATASDYTKVREVKVNGISSNYNPVNRWDSSSLQNCYDNFSIIIDKDMLEGADFIIPSQTTSDF